MIDCFLFLDLWADLREADWLQYCRFKETEGKLNETNFSSNINEIFNAHTSIYSQYLSDVFN